MPPHGLAKCLHVVRQQRLPAVGIICLLLRHTRPVDTNESDFLDNMGEQAAFTCDGMEEYRQSMVLV